MANQQTSSIDFPMNSNNTYLVDDQSDSNNSTTGNPLIHPVTSLLQSSSTLTSQQQQQQQSHYQPVSFIPPNTASPPFDFTIDIHQSISIQQMLQRFWHSQYDQVTRQQQHQQQQHDTSIDYKGYQLPLARIKKIMRIEEDVKMISGEAPIIFSKACELFVLELTLRSWCLTEQDNRRTLQRNDVTSAIAQSEMYDFLIDVIPRAFYTTTMNKGSVIEVSGGGGGGTDSGTEGGHASSQVGSGEEGEGEEDGDDDGSGEEGSETNEGE